MAAKAGPTSAAAAAIDEGALSKERAVEFARKSTFIEDRFESIFRELAAVLAATEALQTRSLALADELKAYAEGETPGIRAASAAVGDALGSVAEERRLMYDRLVARVYQPLNAYASKTKESRTWYAQLQKAMAKPHKTDVKTQETLYLERVRRFEEGKVADVKAILGHLAHSELEFHAHAIEAMSRAHAAVLAIDERGECAESLRGAMPQSAAAPAPAVPSTTSSSTPGRQQSRRQARAPQPAASAGGGGSPWRGGVPPADLSLTGTSSTFGSSQEMSASQRRRAAQVAAAGPGVFSATASTRIQSMTDTMGSTASFIRR
eukprot:m51a1_g563 hypothetical protein (321) ;mRNA; f:500267-501287